MSVADAEKGDIYIDHHGTLWRITEVYRHPTVHAEAVEGTLYDPAAPVLMQAPVMGVVAGQGFSSLSVRPEIRKQQVRDFADSARWGGWRRIYRPETILAQPESDAPIRIRPDGSVYVEDSSSVQSPEVL